MRSRRRFRRDILALCVVIAGCFAAARAYATPWAEVGDAQLRSDIEVLAAAGLIDDVTTQWPLPWGGVLSRLDQAGDLEDQPAFVRAAAERVQAIGMRETEIDHMNYAVSGDFTNLPNVVRGFDALGREDAQGQASTEWMGDGTAVRLSAGAQTANRYDKQTLMFDGSYAMQRVGNAVVYGGYITHWWGPGWDTALSLSNNARPFPQIGITRLDTTPFESPWLSWIGPWQAEFFVGVLDGPRMARNTLFNGIRVSANPFEGFEWALSRTEQSCGTNQQATPSLPQIDHPCKPLAEFFNYRNGSRHVSTSKDETNFDLRYTNLFQGMPYAFYIQVMDRDTGPFTHSFSNHLFGLSFWLPVRRTAIRFTAEYADTISTIDFFSFGNDDYGITYTDYKYTDGWQYRGRTLGSSLDTDSRLASFHASWVGPHDLTYTLSYYHASIGSPQTKAAYDGLVAPATPPVSGNRVTTAPVTVNLAEARVAIPFHSLSVQLAARLQDDQPRPDKGFAASGELSFVYRF